MAHIAKRCNCRDPGTGRTLGTKCPHLAKRSHGAWWFRYEAPPGSDGKRRRPWAGPFDKKSEAEAEAKKRESSAASGVPVADGKMKFGVYLESIFLPVKKAKLKPSTYRSYEEAVRLYHRPGLGHLRLGDVREHHFEQLYAAAAQINNLPEGTKPSEMLRRLLAARATATWTRDGEDSPGLFVRRRVTPARIHRIHAVASSALGMAVKRKILAHNAATHVELPTATRRKPVVWTPARLETWKRTRRRAAPVMVWTPELAGRFLDFLVDVEERLYPL